MRITKYLVAKCYIETPARVYRGWTSIARLFRRTGPTDQHIMQPVAIFRIHYAPYFSESFSRNNNSYVTDWLIDRLTDWLIDWLIDWLVDWLIDWLTDWLVDWLTDWLVDWLIDWLIDWLTDWLIDWLIDWLTDWLIDWLTDWLIDWLTDWLIDWFCIFRERKKWQKKH